MRPTAVKFATSTVTFAPRIANKIARSLRDLAVQIRLDGTDSVNDLRLLKNAERDMAAAMSALDDELNAAINALLVLNGQKNEYYGESQLPAMAESITRQGRALARVDSNLTVLDHTAEIADLESLRDELRSAKADFVNQGKKALAEIQRARLHAMSRCKDPQAAMPFLKGISKPFGPGLTLAHPESLPKQCQQKIESEHRSTATRKAINRQKAASRSLAELEASA